jgi:ADP-ribose pyrophosphatase YjhB (NUDIX family)
MELGESFEEVAEREVREEIGLEIRNLKLLHVFSGKEFYTKTPNGDEFYSVTAVFYTNEFEGTLQCQPSETLEVRFFKRNNLPENMVGSHRRFVQLLENFR